MLLVSFFSFTTQRSGMAVFSSMTSGKRLEPNRGIGQCGWLLWHELPLIPGLYPFHIQLYQPCSINDRGKATIAVERHGKMSQHAPAAMDCSVAPTPVLSVTKLEADRDEISLTTPALRNAHWAERCEVLCSFPNLLPKQKTEPTQGASLRLESVSNELTSQDLTSWCQKKR